MLSPLHVPARGDDVAYARRFEQGLITSADFEDPYDAEHAGACDFGLPDTEICDGLSTPPAELSVAQEAWSRG